MERWTVDFYYGRYEYYPEVDDYAIIGIKLLNNGSPNIHARLESHIENYDEEVTLTIL